jgi:lycopene cyclase domain
MSLYLKLELASLAVPLLFTFNRKMYFYRRWQAMLLSLCIVAAAYIISDIIFTDHGIWGFNQTYTSKIQILRMPIEEWLFFFIIPYASLFLHDTLVYVFPRVALPKPWTLGISIVFVISLLGVAISNSTRTYTLVISLAAAVSIALASIFAIDVLRRYYITFLVILIPFFMVNAVLTGSFIDAPVVWYNNQENLDIRIFTVPIEDIAYAFSLFLFNLTLMGKVDDYFKKTV